VGIAVGRQEPQAQPKDKQGSLKSDMVTAQKGFGMDLGHPIVAIRASLLSLPLQVAGDLGDKSQGTDATPECMSTENNEQNDLGDAGTPEKQISQVIGMVVTTRNKSTEMDRGRIPGPIGENHGDN